MSEKQKIEEQGEETEGEEFSGDIDMSLIYEPKVAVFTIVGISPLLQDNPEKYIGEKKPGPGGAKKQETSTELKANKTYKDDKGRFCHPAKAVVKAIVTASRGKKIGQKGLPGIIMGNVFTLDSDELCPILDPKTRKPIKGCEIYSTSAVNKTSGRIMSHRPVFKEWVIRVPLEFNTVFVTEKLLKTMLTLAGVTVGIGPYRPEKSGKFGRFTVE